MRRLLTLIGLLFAFQAATAQSWEVGGFVGGAGYMGDLNTDNPLKVSGLAGGALVKYNFGRYLSAKASLTIGNIKAADSLSGTQQFQDRNLSFSTRLTEVSLTGEFNFLSYVPSISKNIYTPFIYAGVGMISYTPRTTYRGQTYDLRELRTEGQALPYNNSALVVPFGVGIKYNVAGALNLIADLGYRVAQTDYLDDVSGNYAAKNTFSDPVARALSDRSGERTGIYRGSAGSQRGDLRPRDTYFFVGLSLTYTFITSKCYF